jgi:hypothetical protein
MRKLLAMAFSLALCASLMVSNSGCKKKDKTEPSSSKPSEKPEKTAKLTITKLWFDDVKLPTAEEGKKTVETKGGIEIKAENIDAPVDVTFAGDGVKVDKITIKKGETKHDLTVSIEKAKLQSYTVKATAKSGDTKSDDKSADVKVTKQDVAKKEGSLDVSLSFEEIKGVSVGDKKVEGKGTVKIDMKNIDEAAKIKVTKMPKGMDVKVGEVKDGAAPVTVTIAEVTDKIVGAHEIGVSVTAGGVTKEGSAKLTVSKK